MADASFTDRVLLLVFCLLSFFVYFGRGLGTAETPERSSFKIDGRAYVSSSKEKDWVSNTRVLIDGGRYRGFLRYSSYSFA